MKIGWIKGFCVSVGLALLAPHLAMAAEHGTEAEVQVLVKRAVAAYKADRSKALQSFSDPKGGFVDRDMYVFAQDTHGVILAHGVNPRLVGKDISDIRDLDGKYLVKERIAAAAKKVPWWADYKWPNPVSKEMERKRSYCEMGDAETMICSGIYAP
jgi:signal transduction histidine kinase